MGASGLKSSGYTGRSTAAMATSQMDHGYDSNGQPRNDKPKAYTSYVSSNLP